MADSHLGMTMAIRDGEGVRIAVGMHHENVVCNCKNTSNPHDSEKRSAPPPPFPSATHTEKKSPNQTCLHIIKIAYIWSFRTGSKDIIEN